MNTLTGNGSGAQSNSEYGMTFLLKPVDCNMAVPLGVW
jgi:hypothetical protein